ncbi:hypothetical protein ACFOOM_01160 [Streptomyces echinoruber]|uniref:Uncharacterized protein n=1 Tax=Streptomyces echinoruber TaxID=68898 RepID=A0A918QYH8_9ACTN|nr:hypothetical protein [Streptomyces echinoruber]GGZ72999.1 hypothetical protein GCM10010389_08010 [Streptomyces echinoruber]
MADELAEESQRVINALEEIERIADPVTRAAVISDVLKYVEKKEPTWRDLRRDAVLDLLAAKVSYRKIGAMIHTSHSTVQSIERGHAGAWRTKPRTKPKAAGGEQGDQGA